MSRTKRRITRREDDAVQLADAITGLCGFAPHLAERERLELRDVLIKAIVQATGNPEPEL